MLTIAFRVDAYSTIGNGHLMRCLTLAHQLSNTKNDIYFICREFSDEVLANIDAFGYNVIKLSIGSTEIIKEDTATWLSENQEEDAIKTIQSIKKLPFIDLMIVDSYAIDITWHKYLTPYCHYLMVIDDLANRKYQCDMLLDQTLNCVDSSYSALVPKKCNLMLGAKFMLLRDEFRELRSEVIQNRYLPLPSTIKLLITMGGTDPDNLNKMAISAVHKLKIQYPELTVIIVLSANAPHLLAVENIITPFPWISLKVDVKNISQLMKDAHLAIGTSGGTSWERCCLALPTLTIINADNQKKVDANLAKSGATKSLGEHTMLCPDDIVNVANLVLKCPETYANMVTKSLDICDGKGVIKVVENLLSTINKITFREALPEDCALIYAWQSNKNTRQYFINPKIPTWKEHSHWYNVCLLDIAKTLYLLDDQHKNTIGLLRLDNLTKKGKLTNEFEISIIISPDHQGKKIATMALKQLIKLKKDAIYFATIHEKNIYSQKAFIKAGFKKTKNSYCLHVIDHQISQN